jgi:triosephosphate isomerase (TIM)
MNPLSIADAKKLLDATKKASVKLKKVNIILAPPSVFLRELSKSYRGKKINFAIQNNHFKKEGSYTGEISALQAKDSGASYSLVGHAERRMMGEENKDVGEKMKAVLTAGMTAVLCIGESERDMAGEYLALVNEQLESGFEHVVKKQLKNVVIAYEPVWAIGEAEAMSPRQMHEMAIFIRKYLNQKYGSIAMNVPVLYGGSIDASNAAEMIVEGDVQGLLVGRASVSVTKFTALLKALF